jgi:5'-AMP-activated protein kinase catalytic alpha subunit
MLEEKGFSREYAIRCLDANKHNHVTTCYYLLLKRLEREGKIESSNYYQTTTQTLVPKSLMASKESESLKEEVRRANKKSSLDTVPHRRLAESIENQNRQRASQRESSSLPMQEALDIDDDGEFTNTDLESNKVIYNQ